jgi:hypothetical protein
MTLNYKNKLFMILYSSYFLIYTDSNFKNEISIIEIYTKEEKNQIVKVQEKFNKIISILLRVIYQDNLQDMDPQSKEKIITFFKTESLFNFFDQWQNNDQNISDPSLNQNEQKIYSIINYIQGYWYNNKILQETRIEKIINLYEKLKIDQLNEKLETNIKIYYRKILINDTIITAEIKDISPELKQITLETIQSLCAGIYNYIQVFFDFNLEQNLLSQIFAKHIDSEYLPDSKTNLVELCGYLNQKNRESKNLDLYQKYFDNCYDYLEKEKHLKKNNDISNKDLIKLYNEIYYFYTRLDIKNYNEQVRIIYTNWIDNNFIKDTQKKSISNKIKKNKIFLWIIVVIIIFYLIYRKKKQKSIYLIEKICQDYIENNRVLDSDKYH